MGVLLGKVRNQRSQSLEEEVGRRKRPERLGLSDGSVWEDVRALFYHQQTGFVVTPLVWVGRGEWAHLALPRSAPPAPFLSPKLYTNGLV